MTILPNSRRATYRPATTSGATVTVIAGTPGAAGATGATGATGLDGGERVFGSRIAGRYYPLGGAGNATAFGTIAGVANRAHLAPWYCTQNFSPDYLGVQVTTGVAAATCKVLVYACDTAGWPGAQLYVSAALNCATTNTAVGATFALTFTAGTVYWVGVIHSSTAALRAWGLGNALTFGGIGATATVANYGTLLLRSSLTYASPPTTWAFTAADITNNVGAPIVFARAA